MPKKLTLPRAADHGIADIRNIEWQGRSASLPKSRRLKINSTPHQAWLGGISLPHSHVTAYSLSQDKTRTHSVHTLPYLNNVESGRQSFGRNSIKPGA